MSEQNKELDWEKISFSIITNAGSAKSSAMEALFAVKEKNYDLAEEKMAIANKEIAIASHAHMDVIVKEAQGEKLEFKVLFMHAEDQLLTTQNLILVITELIEIYKKLGK